MSAEWFIFTFLGSLRILARCCSLLHLRQLNVPLISFRVIYLILQTDWSYVHFKSVFLFWYSVIFTWELKWFSFRDFFINKYRFIHYIYRATLLSEFSNNEIGYIITWTTLWHTVCTYSKSQGRHWLYVTINFKILLTDFRDQESVMK